MFLISLVSEYLDFTKIEFFLQRRLQTSSKGWNCKVFAHTYRNHRLTTGPRLGTVMLTRRFTNSYKDAVYSTEETTYSITEISEFYRHCDIVASCCRVDTCKIPGTPELKPGTLFFCAKH